MKPSRQPFFRPLALKAVAAALAFGACGLAYAAQTDLATVPLQTSVTNTVRPNLLFTLDESGSMQSEYIPDYVNASGFCRSGNPGGNPSTTSCDTGDVPYSANAFNGIYYNPLVTYRPPAKWDGTSFPAQNAANTANWTQVYDSPSASDDPFIRYVSNQSPSTINIVSQFREAFFCTGNNGTTCKQNGIDAADSVNKLFDYWQPMPNGQGGSNDAAFPKTVSGTNYNTRVYKTQSAPFYYDMVPTEYCRDANLSECVQSTSPTGLYTFPAYVRFCQQKSQSTSNAVQSDNIGTLVPKCISKFINQGAQQWTFARYAKFKRTDIVSTGTFGQRPSRSDCAAAPTCTYAEEMTNFANWYAYYRSRILMMKTGTGLAFRTLDDRYRIGFITIHPGSPVEQWNGTSGRFLPVRPFDATQKQAFYAILYSQAVGQATPLREALSRAGRYFANIRSGINQGINDDPMEYSCQPNFLLLTTDGFWNSGDPIDLQGNNLKDTDVDNVSTGQYSTRAQGAFDGNINAKGTLADTALYYYQTDLRSNGAPLNLNNCTSGTTGADVCKDNVPTSPADANQKQHMVTFTLGLSDGIMRYQADYDSSATGDFARIKSGASNSCVWATGTCNWPAPQSDQQSALDDLWHAAVNGRGKYYKATDPVALNIGLSGALSNISAVNAAAAAAATSTPNITPTDNFVFSSTYRTVKWDGQVIKQEIDTGTGVVLAPTLWDAQSQLDALAPATRKIYYRDPNTPTNPTLATFTFTNLANSPTLKAYFENQCLLLSQCTYITPAQQGAPNQGGTLNDGATMVDYLRGDKTNEGVVYRTRDHILGDTVNAAPAYVAKPPFNFGDAVTPDYATFKATSTRASTLYIGANDGMLHAFDGASGQEIWAYVPTMVMKNMSGLADLNYSVKHTYFADGSPLVMDAYWGGSWHTVLIAGLNKGGNGYYALDVTNPTSPKVLWEVCNNATLCDTGASGKGDFDADIGLTYGNPIITKRAVDNKWVAIFASGYNNVTGPVVANRGLGFLYVVDLVTGKILKKVATTAGDATTPSGLAKITAVANDFGTDNTALAVYGGDLLGNVWKFDLTVATPTVTRLALLSSNASGTTPQPITTRPEVTKIQGNVVLYVSTGKYLGATDLPNTQQQTVYAFKDTNGDLGALRGRTDVVATDITGATPTTVDWTVKSGWRADLATSGERVNIDPQLIQGTLLVVSNAPDTDACSTGGESFLYQLNYLNPGKPPVPGAAVGTSITRLGSAVAVGLTVIRLPSGAIKAIIPLADTSKQTVGVNPSTPPTGIRRIGWRQLFQ